MRNYVVNGRVAREEIAADICDGILKKSDIKKLTSDPEVRDSFIGDFYQGKKDKSEWNKKYLEYLPNVAVAESFNEDYLLYLADVSEYVAQKNVRERKPVFLNKWFWIVFSVIAVLIILIALIAGIHSNPNP